MNFRASIHELDRIRRDIGTALRIKQGAKDMADKNPGGDHES
jgi:hypothetical protein